MTRNLIRKYGPQLAGAAVALGSVPAFAAGPDFTSLTGAVDVTTVSTAILAIAALLMAPKVVRWGAAKVAGMLGRG